MDQGLVDILIPTLSGIVIDLVGLGWSIHTQQKAKFGKDKKYYFH